MCVAILNHLEEKIIKMAQSQQLLVFLKVSFIDFDETDINLSSNTKSLLCIAVMKFVLSPFLGRTVEQVPCCRVVGIHGATARQVPRTGFTGHARTGESVREKHFL